MSFLFRLSSQWRASAVVLGAIGLVCVSGCHSHYVAADVMNETGEVISPVEVDYPSASFGKETLAPGAVFHYRFKILGDGPTKILWTDAKRHDHSVVGPSLREGEEGTLRVTLTGTNATWETHLKP